MAAWTITCKELRLLAHDRRTLVTLLVMPLLLIAILGFSTGKLLARRDRNSVFKIVLVDRDGGPLAAALIDALRAHAGIDLVTAATAQDAADGVDNGDRVAAVVIGPGFTRRADALDLRDVIAPRHGKLGGGLAGLDVTIRSRPTLTVTGSVVEQWVLAEALRVLLPHVARRSSPLLAGSIPPDVVAASSRPAPLDSGKSAGPEDDSVVFNVLVPSYTVLFTFFLINLMARSLIHERQMGTLFRLRAAPIGSASVLAGQTVPFFMVSVVQGILLFVFGRALFGMSWGHSPAMLLPVLICTSLAATGLGLLTATLVTTEAQISTYATLLVIGLAGISGCFMPRDWLPDLVRDVSLATPHAWALIAYDRLLVRPGADLTRVWQNCGVLLAFAAAFFAAAWLRFRRSP